MSKKFIFIWFFCVTILVAQQRTIKKVEHSLPNRTMSGIVPRTSVRVLALMVEFQRDNDPRTSGDGTFLKAGQKIGELDPPPHDSTYFANKLRFLANYYRKVSNGVLTIQSDLIGTPIQLSKQMSEYSPPTSGSDYRKLIDCIIESWQLADSCFPHINYSEYDAFIIFHAGAGRDIDLVDLLGYNPTPFDLPSLFVDSALFAVTLGLSTFNGISVNGGQAAIKHTMFLPETESRVLPTSPPETLQLSINGLLVATFGSYLGLPDLFDIKTGRSAIGQFGLMDGAGIFAYSGIFPPEPMTWEKIALGWVNPIVVNTNRQLVVPAVGLSHSSPDTIYKIPITSSEYFLVENRQRDPHANGQTLTIVDSLNQEKILWIGKDTTDLFTKINKGLSD